MPGVMTLPRSRIIDAAEGATNTRRPLTHPSGISRGAGFMEPTEEWRPVVGHENQYEVSDQGRIRSVDRIVPSTSKIGNAYLSPRKGKALSPGKSPSGHLVVHLNGISRSVHFVVAAAFIGPRPNGCEVRHINGQPSDCRADNLEYGTRSDNAEDSKRHGTHFHAGLATCKRGHDLTDPRNLQKVTKGSRRVCLACRRERAQLYKVGEQVTVEGHCINGHPMTPENRYTNGTGRSRCKPCALGRRKAG